MKVVILCGGKGQRISGVNDNLPKPMLRVNNEPIIKHIIKIYIKHGFKEFILPLGYRGEAIKQYFMDYEWINCDIKKHVGKNSAEFFDCKENFNITLVDTGLETMTGARIKLVERYIDGDDFMVTYGDGLSDVDINKLVEFHKKHGRIGTVTGIDKQSQYGTLKTENDLAIDFDEKKSSIGIINGGFFVFKNEFLNYLSPDVNCILEDSPLLELIKDRQLYVFRHNGLWLSIDTAKDLEEANKVWGINK